MAWWKCLSCGAITVAFSGGSYFNCSCGGDRSTDHPALMRAADAARMARFEHGEIGNLHR